MNREIELPPGTQTRLSLVPPHALVIVAPPGEDPATVLPLRRGRVTALYTFDPGVTWPDRTACAAACVHLSLGTPLVFQFDRLEDALRAQRRLQRETAS